MVAWVCGDNWPSESTIDQSLYVRDCSARGNPKARQTVRDRRRTHVKSAQYPIRSCAESDISVLEDICTAQFDLFYKLNQSVSVDAVSTAGLGAKSDPLFRSLFDSWKTMDAVPPAPPAPTAKPPTERVPATPIPSAPAATSDTTAQFLDPSQDDAAFQAELRQTLPKFI